MDEAGAVMSETTEAELLFALVRARYESRLTPDELAAIRQLVAVIAEEARMLRGVPLRNADAPLLPSPPADA
jgi:hypothetical protein